MFYYDAHNHLQDSWLKTHRADVIKTLPAQGIVSMVVNGTSEDDWREVADISSNTEIVIPSFGLHPWYVGNRTSSWETALRDHIITTPKAGVGEVGLDRWILERARPDDPRLAGLRRASLDEQRLVLRTQLAIAAELGRPVSIHCIDAWGALLEELQAASATHEGWLLHAYGGPAEMVPAFAELGAYFSFNGSFLDERKKRVRDTFRHVPMERLLVETDAPAMPPPDPWRPIALPPGPAGTVLNHPGNLPAIYSGLAQSLGKPIERLASQIEENYLRLFRIAFTASPAAAKPIGAVTNDAVPKREEPLH